MMDPPGCSVFGLLVGRSCNIDPPSNAKNVTKLLGVELRCRLDLFSSECVNLGRLVPWAISGIVILHKGLFGDGRGDSERSKCFRPVGGELARTPSLTFVIPRDMAETYGGRAAVAAWGEGMARHATLMGVG
ncbi:hypothetical protein B296_00031439 [Ensete ventricosum]|uniref:Uncharacterized protein n=1 Tax=Ensete ventricosum TaxID=4639 RepID=A0A426X4G9_ENSVE|nr:hypothetical protein B296_00031439 [Ensete ventricosum]